jgi:peptide/nickel transport system permease protein
MARFIARRLLLMIPTALVASLVMFTLVQLMPGDAAAAVLGSEATPEKIAAVRHDLGLDQPIPIQYVGWLERSLQGDLGRSIKTREPVGQAVAQRLPVTAELTVLSLLVAILTGLPAGIVAAARRNSFFDQGARVVSQLGVAMPDFWLAVLLIFVFGLVARWLPASGFVPIRESIGDNLKFMVLPVAALGLSMAAVIMRMARSSALEVLAQEYMMVARAKGLARRVAMARHALKISCLPVLTIIGVLVSRLLGGAVIVEEIFQLPGIGRLAADSIFARDYFVLQGVLLVVIVGILLTNLAVDIGYRYLDPRLRYG